YGSPVILISSDSSEESVGSLILRVILFASIISVSSDSSEESVGSHDPRVIFCTNPVVILVIPGVPSEVPSVPADPLVAPRDSLSPAPELPLVLRFLCSDESEADSESEPAE
nr:hypothetical protein [Tanacetum cinerariifolium]